MPHSGCAAPGRPSPCDRRLLLAVSGCSGLPCDSPRAGLTHKEMAYATAIARSEVAKQHSVIRVAVADVHPGRVSSSNTGHLCGSGRLLEVTLIGSFPHTGTASLETVHAEVIEADPATGQKCLISVKTGRVKPPAGATPVPNIVGPERPLMRARFQRPAGASTTSGSRVLWFGRDVHPPSGEPARPGQVSRHSSETHIGDSSPAPNTSCGSPRGHGRRSSASCERVWLVIGVITVVEGCNEDARN